MKVGVIGAGTMGSGIAQAFAMTEGYEVCLCDIKQEFADGGKAKIAKNMAFLVKKEKITQEQADAILAKVTTGLKDICTDCDLIVEAALEDHHFGGYFNGKENCTCRCMPYGDRHNGRIPQHHSRSGFGCYRYQGSYQKSRCSCGSS